jgi:hypothetical protein
MQMSRVVSFFLLLFLTGCASASGSDCKSNVQSVFSQYLEEANADQPKVAKIFSREFLADEVDDQLSPGSDHNVNATRKRLLLGRGAKSVQREVSCGKDECKAHAEAVDGKGMKWTFEFVYPMSSCDDPKVSKIVLIL